jgi:HEPN family protein
MTDQDSFSRNTTEGFARRVRTNLNFVVAARHSGSDVHEVTQLTTSLLGLIVFPWEARALKELEAQSLEQLAVEGWPRWNILLDRDGETTTLGKLTWHLRNAAAHRRLRFSSDAREMDAVEIEFEDARPNRPVDWRAKIRASDLKLFCDRFSQALEDLVG